MLNSWKMYIPLATAPRRVTAISLYEPRGGAQKPEVLATRRSAGLRSNQHLEVVVGGHVLEEVALLLHDAVELVDVDLAIAIAVSLVDHVLELLIVDVLT